MEYVRLTVHKSLFVFDFCDTG